MSVCPCVRVHSCTDAHTPCGYLCTGDPFVSGVGTLPRDPPRGPDQGPSQTRVTHKHHGPSPPPALTRFVGRSTHYRRVK